MDISAAPRMYRVLGPDGEFYESPIVSLPDAGFNVLGLRVPDYSKQPRVRRACWD